jgi:allantoin racemase
MVICAVIRESRQASYLRKIRILSPESIDVPRPPGVRQPPLETTETYEGVQVEVVHRRASDMPVRMVEGDYETDLAGIVNARMSLKAQQEGFDAISINCYNEPGANATKEVCEIPVVSSPGASMAIASLLGNKFSIIISLGGGKGKRAGGIGRTALMDLVKHYGFEQKLASLRAIDLPPPAFNEELISERELDRLRQAVLEEALAAVDEDGADVIISYGGRKVNEYVQKKLPDVPIIDSHGCTVIMAEVLVRLGLRHSKKAYPKPRELFEYYLRKQ